MKNTLILILLLSTLGKIEATKPSDHKIPPRVFTEVSRNYFRVLNYENNFYRTSWNVEDKTNLLREVSRREINFNKFVFNLDVNNKLKHTLSYIGNAMSLGYLDAGIKARATQYGLTLKPGWAYNEFYGRFNIGLQILSLGEYAIYNSESFWDFSRHLIASTLIYSVYEHLGYWTYVNSSIPTEKYGELIGWRGKYFYPHAPNGNDVPWMEESPAGYISRLRGNPKELWVESEDVLIWSLIAPVLAYVIAPNSELNKPNRLTKFKPFVYLDGEDKNGVTGLNNGIKMGLQYEAIKFKKTKFIISGYSNYDLNARAKFGLEIKDFYCSATIGVEEDFENIEDVNLYGLSSTYEINQKYVSISYTKNSAYPFTLGFGGIF